jgi:hypothetical protein
VREVNTKVLVIAVALTVVAMLLSIGTALASKPITIDVNDPILMKIDAKIIESRAVGNNVISKRILFGYFDSGPFEGTINREITVQEHLQTGKIAVQNIVYVTDAVVTVGDRQATGEFVMKMIGIIPNVKWVITTSNLVDSDTGERVELHGQGGSAITYMGAPYNLPETPFAPIHYGIDNALWGQFSLSP